MKREILMRLEFQKVNPQMHAMKYFVLSLLAAAMLLAAGSFTAAPAAQPAQSATTASAQVTFASPDEALQALVAAAKAKDRAALAKLFGPEHEQLLSGDEVEDNQDLAEFANAAQESAQLRKVSDSKYTITIGRDNWPTPVPLIQKDGKWLFDTKAGLEEVLNRRIGENELSAIATCRAYAVAQWEYYTEGDWDHDGVAEYALKLISTPGHHDGLYWETPEGENPSPLGQLIAAASAEGYSSSEETPKAAGKGGSDKEERPSFDRAPYHGYYFKILTRQGPHAPGGKYGYVINGNMIAGYALVAYPDKWGNSGVMTFIINQQGRVYQKNLGPTTGKLAPAMTEYNPDPSWKLVPNEP
jgi:hypothetical protein